MRAGCALTRETCDLGVRKYADDLTCAHIAPDARSASQRVEVSDRHLGVALGRVGLAQGRKKKAVSPCFAGRGSQ
eukprot:2622844-Pyramimonas_sp.AAC.1